MRKIYSIFLFIFIFLDFSFLTFAQSTQNTNISGCPYNFTKDLQYSQSGKDIYILQKILNSDKRTRIASAGVGSIGMESNYFGKGTREALKRFQALFIEYIGVADGKFSGRTREMLQAVCNGKNLSTPEEKIGNVPVKDSNSKEVQQPKTEIPKTPLKIKLSLSSNNIPTNSMIKVFFTANREVKPITPDVFIADGGTISEVRKLSKTEYFTIITPEEGARKISIQIEADRVEDLDGMKNEEASNEITLTSSGSAQSTNSTSTLVNMPNSLQSNLDQILSGLTTSLPSTNPTQISNSTSNQPPYTNYSPLSSGGSTPSGGNNSGFSKMLTSLLGGLGQSLNKQQQEQQAAQKYNETGEGAGAQNYNPSTDPFTGGTVDLSNLNVPSFCKSAPNYGGKPAGKCFDMESTTPLVKEAVALACAAINKQIPIVSASRSGKKCQNAGAKKSQHLDGKAVDIGFLELTSPERQKVFEVFKKKGFNGYGCYGSNSIDGVHLDHGPARRWGPNKDGASWSISACPQELFLGGYAK